MVSGSLRTLSALGEHELEGGMSLDNRTVAIVCRACWRAGHTPLRAKPSSGGLARGAGTGAVPHRAAYDGRRPASAC